jgi:DNA helicase-2/ATP-dependent DNA helicase PcrA
MKQEDVVNDPLLKDLNAQQLQAVIMPNESCIVLAGAGSGKTKVLTTRIAHKIREKKADQNEILGVTFTNKAAKEMRDRLSTMLGRSVGNMWLGTFHGLCHRMLRENTALAGLPEGFTIMDEDDQGLMIKRMLKEKGGAPEDIEPKQLQNFINKRKEAGTRAGRIEPFTPLEDFAVPFYKDYEARCSREGVIDFAELMLRVSELMESSEEFRAKYEGRFKHIQVDEFQDTNAMQYAWLKALMGTEGNIFAVGDDDQSIYAFRGSDPQNMQDFVHEIANDRVVRLEQNYRSTGAILAAANSLIENNTTRLGKNLWTDAGDGNKMNVLTFADDRDEADYMAKMLKAKIASGVDPKDIAILYRSNYQSAGYERALNAHGVPLVIYGGTKFYERMEVKNVISYLRLTTNLQNNGAFMRVVNVPSRKIGEATISQIANIAEQYKNRTNEDGDVIGMSLLEAAAVEYQGNAKPQIMGFIDLLSDLFQRATELPLPAFIDHIIKATGLVDMYSKKEDDLPRLENLKEMVTAAKRFCEESEIEGASTIPAIDILSEFLATATLESAVDNGKDAENKSGGANPNAVTLMTVHASKGLEFPVVIIGGVEDGTFPLSRALDEAGDEEERRLMYVGITRARTDLYVTVAKQRMIYGELTDLAESRFVQEVPSELKICTQPASTRKAGYVAGQKPGASAPSKWASKKPWENKAGSSFKKTYPVKPVTVAPVFASAAPVIASAEIVVNTRELVTVGDDHVPDAETKRVRGGGFFKKTARPGF